MIFIIDYGMGNLFSIKGILEYLGVNYEVVSDPIRLKNVDMVDAASTANLFNFMSEGLKDVRLYLMEKKVNLAKWDLSERCALHKLFLANRGVDG